MHTPPGLGEGAAGRRGSGEEEGGECELSLPGLKESSHVSAYTEKILPRDSAAAAAARERRVRRLATAGAAGAGGSMQGGAKAAEHSPASDTASGATSGGRPAVDREEVCFVAETCASAKLWETMAAEIELLVADLPQHRPPDLLPRERELLFAAWQGLVLPKRSAWTTVNKKLRDIRRARARGSPRQRDTETDTERHREPADQQAGHIEALAEYRSTIEGEIRATCQQCLRTLSALLAGAGVSAESEMFYRQVSFSLSPPPPSISVSISLSYVMVYCQMQGDAIRYQLEVTKDAATREALTSDALAAYTQATAGVDAAGLAPTNPVRLSLALNFAVFHHAILREPKQAVAIARKALDGAVEDLDTMSEESFEATTRSMRQLSEALRSWGAAPEPGGVAAIKTASAPTDFADRERRREYGAATPREDADGTSESASSVSDDSD